MSQSQNDQNNLIDFPPEFNNIAFIATHSNNIYYTIKRKY